MSQVGDYLSSQKYNRVGTSVAFDHTTEAKSYTIRYTDPYTKEVKSRTYEYPHNSIYRNGAYNNDALTKIITQKYIAQVPWLPEESSFLREPSGREGLQPIESSSFDGRYL